MRHDNWRRLQSQTNSMNSSPLAGTKIRWSHITATEAQAIRATIYLASASKLNDVGEAETASVTSSQAAKTFQSQPLRYARPKRLSQLVFNLRREPLIGGCSAGVPGRWRRPHVRQGTREGANAASPAPRMAFDSIGLAGLNAAGAARL